MTGIPRGRAARTKNELGLLAGVVGLGVNAPYLEVTFRRGRALAAYLYLPRTATDKSWRTSRADPGMVIDYTEDGKPIGIEITAPSLVTVTDLNRVLASLGAQPLTLDDVAPLKAA